MPPLTRVRVILATAVLVAALAASATSLLSKNHADAKPEDVGMSTERLARMDKFIHAYVDAGRTPGVVTLIARHGKVVHLDAYGKADLASGRATRTDDIFRMYSMTKPITSVALLMLYEEGKFQITDPLSKYFPAFADVKVLTGLSPTGQMLLDSPKRPITIQDIFRHTAGFTYGFFGATPVDKMYQDVNVFGSDLNGLMAKLPKLPLLYQPGEQWVYSVAHDVQAALVEKLSGQKFDDFVQQRIFTPLGMTESMFRIPADKKARVPGLYTPGRDGKLAVDTAPLGGANYGDAVFGGYSISTTAADYATFAQMLLNKGQLNGVRLLSPKTVELMATNHLPPPALASGAQSFLGPGSGYGLGVSVLMNPALKGNIGSVGEFGWSGAASTHVLIDPKEDLVALYCTQLMNGDFAIRAEFATLLYQSIVGS
jgi:CubicO group peptidase (beta-lactamase class C family)